MQLIQTILIIPTYNAGELGRTCFKHILAQSVKPSVVVIDSGSTDDTVIWAKRSGFDVYSIDKQTFNHGGTRNQAVKFAGKSAEILIFMTQDAILADTNAIEKLLKPFEDKDVAAVCGRQLPHSNATPLAAHARLFNYPAKSSVKSQQDIAELGIKCAFMSNSFAAYRRSVFEELGGFPDNTILAEDMYLTAKMILAGYKVAYCAEACVYHSHNYTLTQEFKRYFDTGVFQSQNYWLRQKFGRLNGEGTRFVLSECKYLWNNKRLWLFRAVGMTFAKYFGFKLGFYYQYFPMSLNKKLSMHKTYWTKLNDK
ncbi:glycosyltransferase [Conservatibacter flavescens]|uniref:Rhamnosyltransferase n=1 Tax=Conservatibacter flavescens TaxID=28161 RepID=A0A2M8RZU1_9PAST|nr:glycosyltransferase [Conservatibacter flavescens]PJG84407.1 rhamnosyltransferase [Conservatibacter flavescens]